jgi:uroporphyrinogen-III synthase
MRLIAIMRPAGYIAESIRLANYLGFRTIAAPMIDIVDKTDLNFKGFVERIRKEEADYVIFTSANGVKFTLLKLNSPDEFIEHLNKTQVVAIGPKTRQALQENGIMVTIMPDSFSSEGLVEYLCGVKGAVIEIARSSHGAPELVNGLTDKGAVVHETQVYQIIRPTDEGHTKLMEKALSREIDIFAFTSSMIARNFMDFADEMGLKKEIISIMNEKTVAAIGKPTYSTLSGFGIHVKVLPEHYTFEEMLRACREKDI